MYVRHTKLRACGSTKRVRHHQFRTDGQRPEKRATNGQHGNGQQRGLKRRSAKLLNYQGKVVAGDGIEPPTRGFSITGIPIPPGFGQLRAITQHYVFTGFIVYPRSIQYH